MAPKLWPFVHRAEHPPDKLPARRRVRGADVRDRSPGHTGNNRVPSSGKFDTANKTTLSMQASLSAYR